ncbi:translocation/assembly module TamB [Nitratidesulfovibrio vulgaris]|uniref:translocation/assembly module TamB n=1 Tax=Nitratidesulfovibrio vulgaris TaxID=881 RepID=UPI0013DF9382|nr:translocation/assembly module TamB [Nitratidesulfovibrio vulgaris]
MRWPDSLKALGGRLLPRLYASRARRVAVWCTAGVTGLLLALLLVLRTPAGESLVGRALVLAASRSGVALSYDRLSGPLPGVLTLEGVRLGDASGEWATADTVALRWRPVALLSGEVSIDALELRGPRLYRAPVVEHGEDKPVTDDAAGAVRPSLSTLPALHIGSVEMTDGHLGGAFAGTPLWVAFSGAVTMRPGHADVRADATVRVETPEGGTDARDACVARLRAGASGGRSWVDARLTVGGGHIPGAGGDSAAAVNAAASSGSLAGVLMPWLPREILSGQGGMTLSLSGDGTAADWRATARADLGDVLVFEGEVALTGERHGADAHTDAKGSRVPSSGAALAGAGVTGTASLVPGTATPQTWRALLGERVDVGWSATVRDAVSKPVVSGGSVRASSQHWQFTAENIMLENRAGGSGFSLQYAAQLADGARLAPLVSLPFGRLVLEGDAQGSATAQGALLGVSGRAEVGGLPGRQADLPVSYGLSMRREGMDVLLDDLRLETDGASLHANGQGQGQAAGRGSRVQGDVGFELAEGGWLAAVAGAHGRIRATVDIERGSARRTVGAIPVGQGGQDEREAEDRQSAGMESPDRADGPMPVDGVPVPLPGTSAGMVPRRDVASGAGAATPDASDGMGGDVHAGVKAAWRITGEGLRWRSPMLAGLLGRSPAVAGTCEVVGDTIELDVSTLAGAGLRGTASLRYGARETPRPADARIPSAHATMGEGAKTLDAMASLALTDISVLSPAPSGTAALRGPMHVAVGITGDATSPAFTLEASSPRLVAKGGDIVAPVLHVAGAVSRDSVRDASQRGESASGLSRVHASRRPADKPRGHQAGISVSGNVALSAREAWQAPMGVTATWGLDGAGASGFRLDALRGTLLGVDVSGALAFAPHGTGGGTGGVAGKGSRATAEGTPGDVTPSGDGILSGGFEAVVMDWKPLAAFAGLPLSGRDAQLHMRFSGEKVQPSRVSKTSARRGGQAVSAVFSAAEMDMGAVSASHVRLDAAGYADSLATAMQTASYSLKLTTAGGEMRGISWLTAGATLEGDARDARFDLHTRGDLVTDVAGSLLMQRAEVQVQRLAVRRPSAGAGVRLTGPARLSLAGGPRLDAADMAFEPQGRARLAFDLRSGTEASLRLHDVPVSLARLVVDTVPVAGEVSGEARVSTVEGRTDGAFRFETGNLHLSGDAVRRDGTRPSSASLLLTGRLAPEDAKHGRLTAALEVGLEGLEAARADISLPVQGLASGTPALREASPVSARVRLRGDVAPFWRFVPLPDRRLAGRADVAVDVTGTVEAPQLAVRGFLCGGRYEDLVQGILLTDITGELRHDAGNGLVCRLAAADGKGGRVVLDGALLAGGGFGFMAGAAQGGTSLADGASLRAIGGMSALFPTGEDDRVVAAPLASSVRGATPSVGAVQGMGNHADPTSVTGQFRAAIPGPYIVLRGAMAGLRPFRRDDLDVTLSGPVELTGPLRAPSLHADLVLEGATLELVNGLGSTVRTLNVHEKGAIAAGRVSGVALPDAASLLLDIAVRAPNRLFVRGRGLDSEWQGRLHVSGTAAKPTLRGSLSPVRGRFSLLGKPFVFTKGAITFAGAVPPDPALDLELSHAGSTVTAFIRVGGRASKPTLTFDSRPSLPQDEVMAHVLFDKSATELSRFEALQAANAMRMLAGVGKAGIDPLATVQETLGIDVLRLGDGRGTQDTARITPAGDRALSSPARQAQTPAVPEGPSVEAGKYLMDNVYVGVEQGAEAGSFGVRVEVELLPRVNLEGRASSTSSDIGVMWKKDY